MIMIPNPVDMQVGSRLRHRRSMLGMTQQHLAAALTLSFQQIQKYERGINRISAGRLYQLSQILDVSIGYFFEGLIADGTVLTRAPAKDHGPGDTRAAGQTKRETMELARAYSHIIDPAVRKRLLEVAKAMAKFTPAA